MEEITFNGEHLLVGNMGRLFVVLSFITSIFGAFVFARHTQTQNPVEKQAARITFGIHLLSVFGIIASLFYIIYNHYFEYQYAWQHSSRALPTHYMVSSFWEGQEGSFLLWLFWEAVLGAVVILKPSQWQSPVMTVILLAQAVLSSMLLGINITEGFEFGSSPFQLLRVADPSILELPVLAFRDIPKGDYMQIVEDGTGLNPLLQNYWMVIHPPTLFFGFATTIIPFAFAIAGLWTRQYKEWIKPALPWALTSVMVLGAGIIMGGIWAYESLSFGGYWAWDPVENASLIPWLILIAGVHVMLINKVNGTSLILTYLLVLGTFILVLYATFLTRSGILNGTSVHSFTDLGLSKQLLVFLLMFVLLPVVVSFKKSGYRNGYAYLTLLILVINIVAGHFIVWLNLLFIIGSGVLFVRNLLNELPLTKTEESIYSREFWMFVGSLVLLLSSIQVLSTTSIPVVNKITSSLSWLFAPVYEWTNIEAFDKLARGNMDKPLDVIKHYNSFQLPFAIVIAVLTGIGQFFGYRKTSKRHLRKNLIIVSATSIILTVLGMFVFNIHFKHGWLLVIFLFASTFAIVGNAAFIARALKFRWKLSGASIAHIGFGLMMVGVLVSSAKKHVISQNTRYDLGSGFDEKSMRENILLNKDQPVQMSKYQVTYIGDSTSGPNKYYKVQYVDTTNDNHFTLYPNAQFNEEQGLMPNPDTKHYLTHDVYTHVSKVNSSDEGEWEEGNKYVMKIGDSAVINRSIVVLQAVDTSLGDTIAAGSLKGKLLIVPTLKVISFDTITLAKPVYITDTAGNAPFQIPTEVQSAKIRFAYQPSQDGGERSHVFQTMVQPPRYIVMKAIVFPYINLLWTGTFIMLVGFALSIRRRLKELKR